ncbi:MAG TPA: S53 family peptidase [Acidobacteriaceae bacterium]|nr:S53 family peptidase [Acidobacteriaceae bacterium]
MQRSARPFVCLGLLTASTGSFGATATPQITQPVDNQHRVTLKGNVRPMPKRASDLGAVDVSMPASRVLLLLKRPAAQEAALQQFIADAHMPGSASYHHWLTPAQLGTQFGPSDSDVQAVVAWLQSQGFAVEKVSQAKTAIEFSGTAGQIESAFITRIHSFQLDGVTHISNITDPQIPAALAPVIAGISPLNDFRPKPLHTAPRSRSATPAPTSTNPKAMTIRPGVNQPNITVPNGNGGNAYYVTPADAATIYNTPNSTLNKNHSGSLNLTGTGVTIGIAGDSNVDLTNVANYRSLFLTGLPPITPTVVVDGNDPGTGSDDEVEALLDLEVASAIAPGAQLALYTAQDTTFQSGLNLAIQRALDDNAINILNVSFGGCEAFQGQSGNQEVLNFWQQAAAQGISVTVSTGDSGSAGCDNQNSETSATQGLQVSGFASTPYNIAVGGTDFNQNSTNESKYWSTTNSSIFGSALGPIPEIPWNDSTTADGALSANVPTMDSQGNTNIAGAGGGVSACLNASVDQNGNVTGCPNSTQIPGFYPKPPWQSSFGTQNARELPDVSLFAADGLHDSAWVLCASGLGANTTGTDCTTDPSTGQFNFQVVGGTSASSPAFAGMLALVINNLQNGGATNVRLGQADYTLYPLSKQFPAAFHDVTTGNIAVVCTAGSTNCGANGFLTGYDAGANYDLASGLGSVDATQMVQNWSSIKFTPTTTSLTVNGATSPISIQHGASVSVGVTVSSSGGTPTGNVALVASAGTNATKAAAVQTTVASPSVLTLSNATATDSAYTYLPGGSYNLTANYGGDGTFASSVSTPGIPVTVSAEPSTLELFIQEISATTGQFATATSVPYGTYISVAAEPFSTAQLNLPQQPAYTSQATGTVTFSSTPAYAPLNQKVSIDSNGLAEIPGQLSLAYPPGTYSVSASYSGDPSFSASSAAAQTFTVTKNTVSIASANGSTSGTVVVEIDPVSGNLFTNSGLALPTGTVTFTNSSGATVGSGTLALVNVSGGQAAQTTITLTGAATTINYAGDGNYNSGSAAFSGGGGSASFSLSAAPTTITVPSGGSATTKISVSPAAGFTGAVSLTCAVTGGTTLQPTCALATPTITISGTTAATDVLTVQTVSSGSAVHTVAKTSERTWYAAGGVALAGILLFGLPRRRRAWQRMFSLMLLIVATGIVGCGGTSSGGGGGSSSTPAGTYTVTVTATSGTITQTSTIMATVQ